MEIYNDTMNSVNNFYERAKEEYTKLIIAPIGKQIYTDDGGSIELDIKEEESLKLSSNITDYTTEDGSNRQSNISLRPIEITLTGLIGEKVIKADNKNKVQKFLEEKLNPLDNFGLKRQTAKVQAYLQKAQQIQNKVDEYINKVGSGIGYLQNLFSYNNFGTRQKQIVAQLITLWKNRVLVNLQTDYVVLTNMAFQDVNITNPKETKEIIQVQMTLKQLTFFKTKLEKRQSKTAGSRKQNSNNGKTTGIKSMAQKIVDASKR